MVGGGKVAERKIRGLLKAGFEVTVVSPTPISGLSDLEFERHARNFAPEDVSRHGIVFACTNDRAVNQMVGHLARTAGKPVIVADAPEESTAFSTAVFRDGPLQVGVSTTASAPGMAAQVRDHIADAIGTRFRDRIEAARAERRSRSD